MKNSKMELTEKEQEILELLSNKTVLCKRCVDLRGRLEDLKETLVFAESQLSATVERLAGKLGE